MTYHQNTLEERYSIGLLRQGGLAPAAIAQALGRHRSDILREVRRNRAKSDGTYRPQLADWYACGRLSHSRRNRRFSPADWAQVQALVREDWSPEQVACWLRRHRQLRARTTAELNRRAIRLIRAQRQPVRTITADNGTEFHELRRHRAATAACFYFATPPTPGNGAPTRTPTG
jgi:IS30 family transposase